MVASKSKMADKPWLAVLKNQPLWSAMPFSPPTSFQTHGGSEGEFPERYRDAEGGFILVRQ